jgi:hypothetical protein
MHENAIDVVSAEQRLTRYRLIGLIGHEVLYLNNNDMQSVLEYIKQLIKESGIEDE